MEEIWKDIEGIESRQISSFGRIRRKDNGFIYKTPIDIVGYPSITMYINGRYKTIRIHTLVAEAFLGKRPTGHDVNHKDGDKTNNHVDNLEYCTRSANIGHAYKTGLNPHVNAIRIVETGETFDSIADCARAIGGDAENIRQCATGRYSRSTCYGYHFEFVGQPSNIRQPKPIQIIETGETFTSARECARAIGGNHEGIMNAIRNNKPYNGLTFRQQEPSGIDTRNTDFLYDYQFDAVMRLQNGNILCGGVGSGKSRSGLFYYFKENGGWISKDGYTPMTDPQDLYIITTAKKRDSLEWLAELAPYLLSTNPEENHYENKVVVDSWNNIRKYRDVTGAFFLLDEQRVVGTGAWTKSFLKIAKDNNWILLTATPADTYLDYLPVFLANGFFKNKTEFTREHVIYSRYTKYPVIERYTNTYRLDRLRNKVLVQMDYKHAINTHHEDVYCDYDISTYKDVMRRRWDIFKDEPITQASGLCYVLRKIVNSDMSRAEAVLRIVKEKRKVIIFYSFDYELEILRNLPYGDHVKLGELNGHKHQEVPDGPDWVYLVNYSAGAEAWQNTRTDAMIFYSQTYSYKVLTQAAGRIDRLNTPFTDLYYYHLKSRSSIDLAISKALNTKKKFNETKFVKW